MEEKKTNQVNISVDDETLSILDNLVEEDSKMIGISNRSSFIRRLIRLEHKRREGDRFELTQKGQMQLKLEQKKGVGQPPV